MKETFKDICTVIVVIFVFWFVFGGIATLINGTNPANDQYYALTTKVVAIDQEADIVTCEDCNGNLWRFRGVEDWEVGDCASLLMESHGTAEIKDDTIKNTRFSAWELTR